MNARTDTLDVLLWALTAFVVLWVATLFVLLVVTVVFEISERRRRDQIWDEIVSSILEHENRMHGAPR